MYLFLKKKEMQEIHIFLAYFHIICQNTDH